MARTDSNHLPVSDCQLLAVQRLLHRPGADFQGCHSFKLFVEQKYSLAWEASVGKVAVYASRYTLVQRLTIARPLQMVAVRPWQRSPKGLEPPARGLPECDVLLIPEPKADQVEYQWLRQSVKLVWIIFARLPCLQSSRSPERAPEGSDQGAGAAGRSTPAVG